jgi:hypothetical protein
MKCRVRRVYRKGYRIFIPIFAWMPTILTAVLGFRCFQTSDG